MRRLLSVLFIFFAGLVFLKLALGSRSFEPQTVNTLNEMKTLVEQHYIESIAVVQVHSQEELIKLLPDRYSRYIDTTEYALYQSIRQGEYVGLGLSYELEQGWPVIYQVYPTSPADLAGVVPGNILLAIDAHAVQDLDRAEIDTLLHDSLDQSIELRLKAGQGESQVQLQSAWFDFQTSEYRLLMPRMGYLKIYGFAETTKDELNQIIGQMSQDELEYLIIDLRGNSGGAAGASFALVDALVPVGPIVRQKARGADTVEIEVSGLGPLTQVETVVLVDRFTASEAEVLTAALMDNGRAVVFGETTYGKGMTVTQFPLSDGGALQLATSRWYRPSGESVEGVGIEPTVLATEFDDWDQVPWAEVW